jgi:glycosyltransferase involved in cell wall biosynthesis
MPFFSIIIPAYNRAHMLNETLRSVKNQTFTDWECIVVDDGSIDNTKEIVNNECNQDKRIQCVYQKNAERSAARNNGIKHAKGQYICFLDSDDTYKEEHLALLYETIKNKNYLVGLFFTNYVIFQDGTYSTVNIPKLEGDPTEYLLNNAVIPARVCIHNEILKEEQFDEDIVIVEDTLLWVRIAQKYPLFHVEKESVVYSLHEDNSINIKNNSSIKRLNGLLTFFNRYAQIKEKINPRLRRHLIGDTYFGIAKHYMYKKQKVKALKNLLLSIIYQRDHPQLKHKIYLILKLLLNKEIKQYQ